jgi:RNA polymerase sigma factor (sigma-70 family)
MTQFSNTTDVVSLEAARAGRAQTTDAAQAGRAQRTDAAQAGRAQRTDAAQAGRAQRTDAERAGGAQRPQAPRAQRGMDARRAELEELYCALSGPLERILRLQVQVHGEHTVIEDACQTAWSQLARHADLTCRTRPQLLAWLITTARREALRLLRQSTRDCSLEGGGESGRQPRERERPQPTVVELVEERERLQALAALPRRQRRLLLLHAAGYSYEEIAQRTGQTRRTVERQLLRARRGARRLAA